MFSNHSECFVNVQLLSHMFLAINSYAAGTEYTRFETILGPINLTQIAKMFCDRFLVNLIVTF